MTGPSRRWRTLALKALGLGLIMLALGAGLAANRSATGRPPSYLDLPRAPASRRDLQPTVTLGGAIDSAEKTIVRCELDNHGTGAGGSAAILEVVEDGALVEEGQVIARLDASDFEELVRQHELLVLQARADEAKARLDLETAEIALREYRDGQLAQLRDDQQGLIALHESNLGRQRDRVAWAEVMLTRGYVSTGQLLDERSSLRRSEVALAKARRELSLLENFGAPAQVKRLEAAVARCREELSFQQLQARHREDQLAEFRRQVELCMIRAPHAGMINYYSKWDPNSAIEPGAMAYREMPLFYLPNLDRLEVWMELHESMLERVRVGQPASIRVNALPGRTLEGRVVSVDVLPKEPVRWWLSREIRNFLVKVAVHAPPRGLYPGMTASVTIRGEPRLDALAVPASALAIEDGRPFVYVAAPGRLERRAVHMAPGDLHHVEILGGLAEGEQVILQPSHLDPADLQAAVTVENRPLAALAPGR